PTPKRTTADSASRAVAEASQVISPCRAVSADCACSLSTMHTVDERRRSGDHPARRDAEDRSEGRTSVDPEDYSERIADLAPARGAALVAPPEATGRTVSAAFVAVRPVPAFPTSAMDGFALDEAAWAAAARGEEITVVGDTPAGHESAPLSPGCAVRVMTGAPVPTGAEAVVPVELTDAEPTGPAPATIRLAS